jgi:hypothetical protein
MKKECHETEQVGLRVGRRSPLRVKDAENSSIIIRNECGVYA